MPRQRGIQGDPWTYCDRCGWKYRVSELTMQNGQLLCRTDVDDPTIWHRNTMIADVLGDGKVELENMTAKKRSDPNVQYESD